MLIDAGSGDKMTARSRSYYRLEREVNLSHSLSAAGVSPDSIYLVLATHLHFDHRRGVTERRTDGSIRPRFSRRSYVIRRGEWEDPCIPTSERRALYSENYERACRANIPAAGRADATIIQACACGARAGTRCPSDGLIDPA